eukprot:242066_1
MSRFSVAPIVRTPPYITDQQIRQMIRNNPNLDLFEEFCSACNFTFPIEYGNKCMLLRHGEALVIVDDQWIRWMGFGAVCPRNARKTAKKSMESFGINCVTKSYKQILAMNLSYVNDGHLQMESMDQRHLNNGTFFVVTQTALRLFCIVTQCAGSSNIRRYYLAYETMRMYHDLYIKFREEIRKNRVLAEKDSIIAHQNNEINRKNNEFNILMQRLNQMQQENGNFQNIMIDGQNELKEEVHEIKQQNDNIQQQNDELMLEVREMEEQNGEMMLEVHEIKEQNDDILEVVRETKQSIGFIQHGSRRQQYAIFKLVPLGDYNVDFDCNYRKCSGSSKYINEKFNSITVNYPQSTILKRIDHTTSIDIHVVFKNYISENYDDPFGEVELYQHDPETSRFRLHTLSDNDIIDIIDDLKEQPFEEIQRLIDIN